MLGVWGKRMERRQDSLFRPETSFTKICIVSSSLALELMLEMLELRRMMAAVVVDVIVGAAVFA
jgi:hypothetical protein